MEEGETRTNPEYTGILGLPLAEMQLPKLLEVEANCRAALTEAQNDLATIIDYIDRRYPEAGSS